MDSITISSSFLIPTANSAEITPAMLNVIWFLADKLDRMRIDKIPENGLMVKVPSKRLRNPEGRSDNVYLRDTLDRLLGIQLHGESVKAGEWGAVLVAQWAFKEGGTVTELLIPPAAIASLKAPKTFAKIEVMAAYKLSGHARRLYAALADKKNLTKQSHWDYSTPELRVLFDTREKYPKWYDLSRYVLQPALDEINDFGTVKVRMTTRKEGRSIIGVRFAWEWKDPHDAEVTAAENERHSELRHKSQTADDMPPLSDEAKKRGGYDAADHNLWKLKNPSGRVQEYQADLASGYFYWRQQ